MLRPGPAAYEMWVAFHDHIEALMLDGRELSSIRGIAAKAAEHAARLAGVQALVEDLQIGVLQSRHIEAGIELAQFYLTEALRLFDGAAEKPELRLAEKALAWGRAQPECRFLLADLYQRGPNPLRSKEVAQQAMAILMDHGWARPLPDGTVIAGKPRKTAWEVRS